MTRINNEDDLAKEVLNEMVEQKDRLLDNLEHVLRRGEKLDVLKEKSRGLSTSSDGLKRNATRWRKDIENRERNYRCCCVLAVVVLGLAFAAALLVALYFVLKRYLF